MEDEQCGRWEATPEDLKVEARRLREVVAKAHRDTMYAIASDDPHDWKKGLRIVNGDMASEIKRPRGSD